MTPIINEIDLSAFVDSPTEGQLTKRTVGDKTYGIYTLIGNSTSYKLVNTLHSSFQGVQFYMGNTASVTLDGNDTTFEVPVEFFTRKVREIPSLGLGRSLTLIGTWNLNAYTVMDNGGASVNNFSTIYFGAFLTPITMNCRNDLFLTNSNDVLKLTGSGKCVLQHSDSRLNIYLNYITAGIHQFIPRGYFTVSDNAKIYAICGSEFATASPQNLVYTSYMVMDPPAILEFNSNMVISVNIPNTVQIIINAVDVTFINSLFYDETAIQINSGCTLTAIGCIFNEINPNTEEYATTVPIVITGDGTLYFYNGEYTISPGNEDEVTAYFTNTINAVLGSALITAPDATITMTGQNLVYVPPEYGYFDTIPIIQNSEFVLKGDGTYNFGTFDSYPLTINFPGVDTLVTTSYIATVLANALLGSHIIFPPFDINGNSVTNNNIINLSTTNTYYSSSDNNNAALWIEYFGYSDNHTRVEASPQSGTVNFGNTDGEYTSFYATSGQQFILGTNVLPTGNYKFYLYANDENTGSWVLNNNDEVYTLTDMQLITTNDVYLWATNTDSASSATYTVTIGSLEITLNSDIETSGNVTINGNVDEGVLTIDMQNTVPIISGDFYDGSAFDAPLVIYGGGHFKASSLNIYIRNSGTWPYLGTLDGVEHPLVYFVHGNYDFDSNVANNYSWYNSDLYFIDNGADGSDEVLSEMKYDIQNINLDTIHFFTNSDVIPYVQLESSQQIIFNVTPDTYYIIATNSVLSNEDSSSNIPVFTLNGNVDLSGNPTIALYLYGNIDINVFHQYVTDSLINNVVIHNDSNAYINYYTNTYDFSLGNHYLEYANGLILKSPSVDGTYTFSEISQYVVMYVNDDIDPKIFEGTFDSNIKFISNSTENLTFESSTFNITLDDQVILDGSGNYNFIGDSLFNINANITEPIKMIGTCSLTFGSLSFTSSNTYQFVVKSNTAGPSTIDFGNNTFFPVQAAVYWQTLEFTDSNQPFTSGTNSYFATNYVPADAYSIIHNTNGYYNDGDPIDEIVVAIAGGKVDTTATQVVASIGASHYSCFNEDDYSGKLDTLFGDENIYTLKYYGALSSNQTENKTVASNNTKVVVTIAFADVYTVYLGDASMNLSFDPDDDDFGTAPQFLYSIVDENLSPTFSTITESIEVNADYITHPIVEITLDHGFGLPMYIFPYYGSDENITEVASLFKYVDRTNDENFLTYTSYLDADSSANVKYITPGSTSISFNMKYQFDSHVSYNDEKNLRIALETLVDHSTGNVYETPDIPVTNHTDYSYPIVGSDYNVAYQLGPSSSEDKINITDDGALGTYSPETITYSKIYYIGIYTQTADSSDHQLLISGSNSQFSYTFETYDGYTYDSGINLLDNVNGTATLTIPFDNYSLHPVRITVTTTSALNEYYFGQALQQSYFTIIDQNDLIGPGNDIITPTATHVESNFSFPPVIRISLDNSTFSNTGSVTGNFDKGTPVTIYVKTIGKMNDDVNLSIQWNITRSDPVNQIISESDNDTNIASFNIQVDGGQYMATRALYPYNDDYISGNATYTFTITSVEDTDDNTYDYQTIDNVIITDNSRYHQITFSSGLGADIDITSTTTTSDTDDRVPETFTTESPTSLISKTSDLAQNIGVQFNSMPYDVTAHEDYEIIIHYIIKGKVNLEDDWTSLELNSDYYIYSDTNFDTTTDNTITINRSTFDENSNLKYFVLDDDSEIQYVQISYYATDSENNTISENCDYANLPSSGSPAIVALFDYTAAETGTVGCRILSLGNWQIRSDNGGNLIFAFTGSVGSDNYTTRQYTFIAPRDENTVNNPSYMWDGYEP